MAVISISITASTEQIVAGIPRSVSISTNIPASIFYTLDGSVPTLFSNVYTSPIIIPNNSLTVVLNVLASNGVDTSPIVTETYITNAFDGTNARVPRASTTAVPGQNIPNPYPFGTNSPQPNSTFVNSADAGITVYNPSLPATPTGFDGYSNPTGFTNQPYDITNYDIQYSITDSEGQTGGNIGTLPGKVRVELESEVPETTDQNSYTFDPRAFVVYQDVATEDPSLPPNINRMFSYLENPEKARDGNTFFTTGLDSPAPTSNFLRSHYNPRTNNITYYYYDSVANRWIISTAPYVQNGTWTGNLSGTFSAGGGAGGKYVYQWIPFMRRLLF